MKELTLSIPGLYADHHVLRIRRALDLPGVEELYASSAWHKLWIRFDEAKLSESTIEETIRAIGYGLDAKETPILVERIRAGRDPQWEKLAARVTKTNPSDLKMSGEFRRY
ncbi:MAG: hypothetical protein JXA25_02145 [Anaerolineales bacterium]|nr:hypothetical protein [Anaerolineales bacterium]